MSYSNSGFTFGIPTRIEFGTDKFKMTGKLVKDLGRKALIVSTKGGSLKALAAECQTLLAEEGVRSILFEEAVTNPDSEIMDSGRDLADKEGCDLIIGLGGGSAIDTAKAVAVTVPEKTGIWEIVEGLELSTRPLPVVAIPTTSGTGSEATRYAVISNHEKKMKEGLGKKEFYPVLSIVDPMLTISMPMNLTAATGLDALTHAVEGFTTRFANPVTDSLAELSIELIGKSLRTAVFNGKDIVARSDMMLASMLAGIVITHTDTSLSHVLGEAVGAVFGIHHGLAVSLTLPAVMEYNCFTNVRKFKRIAELLGEPVSDISDIEAAKKAPEAVRKLISDTKTPQGLRALGVEPDEYVLDLCSRPGSDDSNLRPASREDLRTLLKGSLGPEMSYWEIKP